MVSQELKPPRLDEEYGSGCFRFILARQVEPAPIEKRTP